MSAKDKKSSQESERLLLPLRSLRDYNPQDSNAAAALVNKYKTHNPKDDEDEDDKSLVKDDTAKATLGALGALGEGGAEGGDGAKVTNAVNVDFTAKDTRGKKKRLCSWERFICDGDEECLMYFLTFLDGKAFAGLSLGSKSLYVKVKHMKFTISMTAKGFGVLSSNVRRGVGHGFVEKCDVACGGDGRVIMNTSCNINAVNSITAFFMHAYPMKCQLSHLKMAMDVTVNEIGMRGFLAALHKPHAQNLRVLSLEGSGIQTLGLSLLGDAMIAKKLPALEELNVSRNNGLYLGIHKIRKALEGGHCPTLASLNVTGNSAKSAVLEFFERSFAERVPNLKRFCGATNDVDFSDSGCIDLLVRGKLSLENFTHLDLSDNTLIDTQFVKLFLAVAWNIDSIKGYSEEARPVANMQVLRLDVCELGNATLNHLSGLALLGYLENLEEFYFGTNQVSVVGVESILRPLRDKFLQGLTSIIMPLNPLNAEGLNLMMSAQTLGVFDHLVELDLSDCGCNLDTIALFGRAILARHDQGKLSLRKLRLFGMSPNARRQAKAVFPMEFIVKCGVT